MAQRALTVHVEGLAGFRRALKRIDAESEKDMRVALRGLAEGVRVKARGNAPSKTGALRKSIRRSVSARKAEVYTVSPYGGVMEYGGSIAPRGTPYRIQRHNFMGDAITDSRAEIVVGLARILDNIADSWERK